MDISRNRQKILSLQKEMSSLLDILLGRAPIFAGSLYEQKSKCGKPQCKCAKGSYRHRQWCLSFVEEGASRTRVVPPEAASKVERLTQDYREFRRARRELMKRFEELLRQINKLEGARRREGKKRYARVIAKAKSRRSSDRSRKGG